MSHAPTGIDQTLLLSSAKGLILPPRSGISPDIEEYDYDMALLSVASEYDGISTLIQKLRLEKYKNSHFAGNWNPFYFENPNTCIPYETKDIPEYGYDRFTDNCKCPESAVPCTREAALQDIDNWLNKLKSYAPEDGMDEYIKNLKVMTKHLNIVNSDAKIIKSLNVNENLSKKNAFCTSANVVLCSTVNYDLLITQWFV